jgi:5-enolpyruvylshikimate-3-phosphate synthase
MLQAQFVRSPDMRRVPLVSTVFALLFGVGITAFASDEDSTRSGVPREEWRPITEIIEQFTTMGYEVRGVEDDDGVYEVEAIDANGLRVKADVDPVSGEILSERHDDD